MGQTVVFKRITFSFMNAPKRTKSFFYHILYSVLKKTRLIYLPVWANDLKNKIKYGLSAPVFAERIYIKPAECNQAINSETITKNNGVASTEGFRFCCSWQMA